MERPEVYALKALENIKEIFNLEALGPLDPNNIQQPLYWLIKVGGNKMHCKLLKLGVENKSGYDRFVATNDDFISTFEFGESRTMVDKHGNIVEDPDWFDLYFNRCLKKKLKTGTLVLYDKNMAPNGNIYIGTANDPLIRSVYGDEDLLNANGKPYPNDKKFVIKRTSAIELIAASTDGKRCLFMEDYLNLLFKAAMAMAIHIASQKDQ